MSNNNSVKITGMIIVGVLLVMLIGTYAFFAASSSRETITATGISSITVVPDLVSVYFNIETNGSDAKNAKDANAKITDAITQKLIDAGFEKNQIETMNYNVYEDFEYTYDKYSSKRVSKGYKAVHSIRIKFSANDSDKIGEVIDAGIDSGAMLSYINFELSQEFENQNKAEALRLASVDARTKAESMADGLNAKLGKIVSVSNSDFGYTQWLAYDNAAGAMVKSAEISSSIQPSEHEINAQVSVVYKLK